MLGDFLTARCGTELPVGAANRNIRLRRHRSFVNPLKFFPTPGLLASRESLVLCENIMKPPLASPPYGPRNQSLSGIALKRRWSSTIHRGSVRPLMLPHTIR